MSTRSMSTRFIGIDPGLGGAIAVVGDVVSESYAAVHDMPTVEKKSGKREVDAQSLLALFDDIIQYHDIIQGHEPQFYCLIERVHAAPVQGRLQGVASMFSMGDSFGVARALAQACFHRVDFVIPAQWKKAMSLTKDKGYSLGVARRMFPDALESLKFKKNEGRAEALLLAKYASTKHQW